MNTQGRTTHHFGSSRGLALSACLFIGVTIIAAGFAVWDLRVDRIADEMKDTQSLGVVLAEQTERTIQAVDLVVQQTQAMVLAGGVQKPDQFRQEMGPKNVHDFLAGLLNNLPQADALALIDDAGKVTNFSRSWPAPVIDTSDREYFRYLRDHDAPEAFIGPPIRSKVNGAWTIAIARRVNGPNGEFLGIVAGYVEAQYFEDFYKAISARDGESVSLFRRDGILVSRYPNLDARIGEKLSSASPWYEALADGGGTYRSQGYIGGVPRIVSVQPVHGYPLAVTVGVSEYVALAPWRRQSTIIAVGAAGAVVGFGILFRALSVQFGRLERSQRRFRDFAQSSSDWLWETDQDHRFTYLSEGVNIIGLPTGPGGSIGRTRREVAGDTGGDPAKWEQDYSALERHEPVRAFTYTWKNADGLEGIASISGNPFFDPGGRFLGYRGIGRDITEAVRADRSLRDAKEAAEAANLAKSQFLANVSHELRTPLNAIIGFSEMLERGMAGFLGKKQKEYAGLVRESGQHLLNVINDILDLAHVDSGKFELHEETGVDLQHIIDGCISLMRDRAKGGDLRLSTEIEDQLPLLVADPTRLKQILLNLMSNAIKFTGPGGAVIVAAQRSADAGIAVEVRDTGLGMTPDEIDVALEPFGQVDASHTRQHEGTGLGLPLARRLAELHDGSLHVSSEKGHGTTVTVMVPASRVIAGTVGRLDQTAGAA